MTFKHGLLQHLRVVAIGGLAAQALWLLSAVGLLYLILAPLAYFMSGTEGLMASAVAAGICLFGSLGALAAMQPLKGPAMMFSGVVIGMFLRMAVPLIFCLIVYLQPSLLTRAGMVFYVLAFYMVTLTIDAVLTAMRVAEESLLGRDVQSHG